MARWLVIAVIACAASACAGVEDGWSGVISVDETIHGPPIQGGDQRELEHFALAIQDRVHQARTELVKAPPFMARLIREDIGFYQTELDRILAEKGGDLKVGHTVYFISGDRMLVVSDGARLLFNHGQVDGVVDGHILHSKVQEPPDLDSLDDKPDGETMQGYKTKRVQRHLKDHTYDIDVAVGLPNPYRIGLLDTAQDLDLMRSLADLPGLPMAISEVSGDVQRSLHVDNVTSLKVSDDIFEP